MNRNQNSLILLAGYVSQAYKLHILSTCFLTELYYLENLISQSNTTDGWGGGERCCGLHKIQLSPLLCRMWLSFDTDTK